LLMWPMLLLQMLLLPLLLLLLLLFLAVAGVSVCCQSAFIGGAVRFGSVWLVLTVARGCPIPNPIPAPSTNPTGCVINLSVGDFYGRARHSPLLAAVYNQIINALQAKPVRGPLPDTPTPNESLIPRQKLPGSLDRAE